jgi:hypothetical protein
LGLGIGAIVSLHLGLDPLHHAATGAALSRGLENTLAAGQRCADRGFSRWVDLRPTDWFAAFGALLSRPGKASVDALLDYRALELSKYAEHLEERPSGWGGCVDRLLFQIEPGVSLSHRLPVGEQNLSTPGGLSHRYLRAAPEPLKERSEPDRAVATDGLG